MQLAVQFGHQRLRTLDDQPAATEIKPNRKTRRRCRSVARLVRLFLAISSIGPKMACEDANSFGKT